MSKPIVRGIYRGVRVTQIERTTRLEYLTGRYAGRLQVVCMAGHEVMTLGLVRAIIDHALNGTVLQTTSGRVNTEDTDLDLEERERITLALGSHHRRASDGTE